MKKYKLEQIVTLGKKNYRRNNSDITLGRSIKSCIHSYMIDGKYKENRRDLYILLYMLKTI